MRSYDLKLQKEHKDNIKVIHTVKIQWFNPSLLKQYNLRVRGACVMMLSHVTHKNQSVHQ